MYQRIALVILATSLVACIEPLPTPGEIPEVRCGDGVTSANEACDDGNLSDRDACTNLCEIAVCNDGIKRLDLAEDAPGYEVCDDGNSNENDGCTSLCKPPACHDGIKQIWEACDDGNTDNTDACVGECELSTCGDGFVRDGFEGCDPQADDAPESCGDDCELQACGNGIIEGEEACDDGNRVRTDACTNQCAVARCGDGIKRTDLEEGDEGFEVCDGEDRPQDARWCSIDCRIDDHGNSFETATPMTLSDQLTANLAADDEDWFKLVAPVDATYVFTVVAQGDDQRGDNSPRLYCEAREHDQLIGSRQMHDMQGFDSRAGCEVTVYRAAGETVYLRLVQDPQESEHTYDVRLKPICGNGFHDPGEQCDPTLTRIVTSSFSCRADCRARQQAAISPTNVCIIDDGDLRCWGSNHMLQLGAETAAMSCQYNGQTNYPVTRFPTSLIPRDWSISTIALTHDRACVVARDGNILFCWGFEPIVIPQRLWRRLPCRDGTGRRLCTGPATPILTRPATTGVSMGSHHQCGIWNGRVGCWGVAAEGSLGAGNHPRNALVPIENRPPVELPEEATYVTVGFLFTCAIDVTQQLWCWGANPFGQVGAGTIAVQTGCLEPCARTPRRVEGIGRILEATTSVYHACALNDDGEVWCWGNNTFGQIGAESDAQPCVWQGQEHPCVRRPVRVAGIPRAIDLAAGDGHTCIITEEGAVWCWGFNMSGQIGTGNFSRKENEPKSVAALPPVESIFLGGYTSCARRGSDVWCWGRNNMSQLGLACGGQFSIPRRLTTLD